MAYRIEYKDPRDLDKRKAIGIEMPFSADSVFVSTYDSLEAYKVNIYNFFMTEKEERYLNPDLGSNLLQYLFDQSLDLDRIKETIQFEIKTYFPKIEIVQIQFNDYSNENFLQIGIKFRVKGTELEDSLLLDVNR